MTPEATRGGDHLRDPISSTIADVLAEITDWRSREPIEGEAPDERAHACRLTEDPAARKGYAAFYTREPIAYLLAFLAILSPNDSWRTLEGLKGGVRVCDFACGERGCSCWRLTPPSRRSRG